MKISIDILLILSDFIPIEKNQRISVRLDEAYYKRLIRIAYIASLLLWANFLEIPDSVI